MLKQMFKGSFVLAHNQLEVLQSKCEIYYQERFTEQVTNQLAVRIERKVAGGLFAVCRKALTVCLALSYFPANISHITTNQVSLLR